MSHVCPIHAIGFNLNIIINALYSVFIHSQCVCREMDELVRARDF